MSGAGPSVDERTHAGAEPRFDWYAATLPAEDPFSVLAQLAGYLECDFKSVGRGLHGYTEAFDLVNRGGVRARALLGGVNPGVHAWASGEDTDVFVETVRAGWPEHRVARADSAYDFDEAGTWERLYGLCVQFAEEKRLKVDQQGDWLRGEEGRTFYLGSRKSPAFVRLYEKGKQVAGQTTDPRAAASVSRDWVRLELQLRPQRSAKSTVAGLPAEQVWAVSTWTRELVNRALQLDLQPVVPSAYREADDDRALAFMLRQYGPLLGRLAEGFGGDWASLGLHLQVLLSGEQLGGVDAWARAVLGVDSPAPGFVAPSGL